MDGREVVKLMRTDRSARNRVLVYIIIGVLGSVGMLWTLSYVFRAGDPNVELVRTTREAMETAREAREDAEITRRTSSALRILALMAGVVTPLIVVYLIYRLHARSEPGAEDLLDVLKSESLLPSTHNCHRQLPRSAYRLLDDQHGSPDDDKGN